MADDSNPVRPDDPLISVVLPLYNEAAVLHQLAAGVRDVLLQLEVRYEIVFVNDGSSDDSGQIVDEIDERDGNVRVLHLSRNFGHQAAVQAGLQAAKGDAVVVMDSDLQDDPSAIGTFIDQWRRGYDVVFAPRTKRKEGIVRRSLFYLFYRMLNGIAETPIPNDAGNFGLVDRRVAESIVGLPERDRFYPGLRNWVGFRQTGVDVERHARYDDEPRVSIRGLFRLAKSAVFSFSTFPLMMFYGIAAVSAMVCTGFVGFTVYHKLFTGLAIPGWTSTIVTASFFGSLNALGISILGEYVIRIHDQVRRRPPYIVGREIGMERRVSPRGVALMEWVSHEFSNANDEKDKRDTALFDFRT